MTAATNTNTNGTSATLREQFTAFLRKKNATATPTATPAPVPTPTPTPEPSQVRSAGTRKSNATELAATRQELAEIRAELATLTAALTATPTATAAQAPTATAAPKRTRRRKATQPRPQAREAAKTAVGSPSNLFAVNLALEAKGCGCDVAYTKRIWADNHGETVTDGEQSLTFTRTPDGKLVAAWSGPRIMQVFCKCQLDSRTVDAPTAAPTEAELFADFTEWYANRS